MERVVTATGAGIQDDAYLDAILEAIENSPFLQRSDTYGENGVLLCSVSLHWYLDPENLQDRWAVVLDAAEFEVRDYNRCYLAANAYDLLASAWAADGVMWSLCD